jgi:hypothetical protein
VGRYNYITRNLPDIITFNSSRSTGIKHVKSSALVGHEKSVHYKKGGNPIRKKPTGRSRLGWTYNIKMGVKSVKLRAGFI